MVDARTGSLITETRVHRTHLKSTFSVCSLVGDGTSRLVMHPVNSVVHGVSHFSITVLSNRLISYTSCAV